MTIETPKLISITGFISSGKDTLADYLTIHHGFKKLSFAASLKDAIADIFGWDRELLEGSTKYSREWRDQIDLWWSKRLNMPTLTPRAVLQFWGTEVCRKGFHDDIWIASLEHKMFKNKDNVVITDCRFPNELKAIKNAGGITIRINRGPKPDWYHYAEDYNKGPRYLGWAIGHAQLEKLKIHASEYSSVGLNYDYTIDNDGTVSELHEQLDKLIFNISPQQDHLVAR